MNGTLRSTRAVSAKQVGRTLIAGVVNRPAELLAVGLVKCAVVNQGGLASVHSSPRR